ncbi:protein of unknown function [Agrobacterium pusense]|uniref:Uncharacterized protein n=1 Tax=Agrobacterium pusense TaxID=648995 RepID=U4QAK1_9HYPH|nr:protein of unknown function [Agrobacterium pusense]
MRQRRLLALSSNINNPIATVAGAMPATGPFRREIGRRPLWLLFLVFFNGSGLTRFPHHCPERL